MSPPSSNFHGFQHQSRQVINGPRPSPLLINRHSHSIRKTSSLAPPTSVAIETSMNPKPDHHQQQQIRKPIIIYTYSPKIIHTKPEDFMDLVQKLTGMPRPPREDHVVSGAGTENLESSLSDESISSIKQGKDGACDGNNNDITSSLLELNRSTGASEVINYSDIPLFTPNSSYFLSPNFRSVDKYSDSPFGILGSLISPSGLEFIKELPDY